MDRSYAQGTGEPHRNFSESTDQERISTASYHPVNPAAPLLRQSSAARIVPKPLTRVDSRPHFSPVSETPPRQFESQRAAEYYPDTARYTNNKPPESLQRQSDSVQRQPDSVQRPLKVVPERTYDRPEQSPGYSYSQYTKPPTNNTYQSKPDLVNKPLENNVERQNTVQRTYQPTDITRDNRTEVPSRNVDPPSRTLDVPSRNLEVPPRNLEVPSRNLDVPSRNLEVPSRNLDAPARILEVPARTLDVPTRNVTRLNGNNLELRQYENNKTSSENRPLIENRPNHVTENRQPFENHIATENRSIPKDLPESRLSHILENRPPVLENRQPILENRIGPPEVVLNRPTPDIQPRRIEVPEDRPRPEPPPILRQPSNPNLQPAPFRAPGGGVRLFRQFVNTQLIPARSPDFQRPLNPPISQDGMGLNASREDHNRLIKLARNEMESPRPESVTGDRPVRVEQPPPQRKPEPPFVEMQRPLTSTEQPDSLNSLKSSIMPSGKPVAKEMTITVSGKLPPQPQPTRPTKPENRPSIQVKKPFDGSEPLRHMDSNLDSQRPPFNESGNHFNDSSSSNLTNYRRAEEYTENGRRNPEPSFYINDPAERFSKPPELLKRPDRSMNFESNERNLTSMAYTPPPENNGNQVTSRPGSGEHEGNSKQRPSDLNLSGMVSEKKGRVGWKGEEKKNNPGTPADSKGVSFVETPRKKTSDGKAPAGTWCAQTGRFIPSPFERPKSPDPRPKTPTTPKKKRFLGTYCAKTGRYIPPEGSVQTPRDDRKTPDLKLPGSGRSTPDVRMRSAAATPRDESPHVSFIEERCFTPRTPKKPLIAFGSVVPQEIVEKRRQKVRRTRSNDWVERRRYTDGDHDSGVDESTQEHATSNGDVKGGGAQQRSRAAAASKIPGSKRASTPGSPASSPLKSPNKPQGLRSASLTPEPTAERKKLPMNKIQVGTAASPNLKVVRSKIGSLDNATHKPGGGQVRIESRKVDFSKAGSRIAAKNEQYQPGGGDKKIESKKLQWNAKSKIGSLENTTHKPGGGDKKIESQKLEFKDKAKSKVGSKDNMKHSPGGGNVKIEDRKLEFKVQSKVGSLANVTHKPGGGDVKIFDDKEYIRQMSGTQTNSTGTHSKASSEGQPSGTQSPVPCSPGAAGMSQQPPLSPSRS